jgi:hypothetical protein
VLIDPSGANDHIAKVDAKIKHLKEVIRCVNAELPWKVPDELLDDLVKYATSRINARRTTASCNNVAPKVALTGKKINYEKEFGLSFGDYCEVYDPRCTSNDALENRTEPCIALYPTHNSTDSWMFRNLLTGKEVCRSNWTKMKPTQLVIDQINNMSAKGVTRASSNDAQETTPNQEAGTKTPEREPSHMESEDEISVDISIESAESDNPLVGQDMSEEDSRTSEPEPLPMPRRASARISAGTRRPIRYAYHTSVKKGLAENYQEAYEAITVEFKQLFKDKQALIPVKRSELAPHQKVIRSSMFLKTKFDAKGEFEKVKARLVADGSMQDSALYPDRSAPTASMMSIMTCLTIAAKEGAHASKIDIGGAYLNANMAGEPTVVELDYTLTRIASQYLPELLPFVENGKLLVRLNKALYGCIQSAKLWYDKLIGTLEQLGFARNEVEPCVMTKTIDGKRCILTIYVDDILVLSEDRNTHQWVADKLREVFDDVKVESSEDLSYLGMHVRLRKGECIIAMKNFTEALVTEYTKSHPDLTTRATPATSDLFNVKAGEELDKAGQKYFHSTVAKLLYLAKRTRPDILTAVSFLTTRQKHPTKEDQKKLDRVMGYLAGTCDKPLVLSCKSDPRIIAYIDASFGCHLDGMSHTGATLFVGQGCVQATSRKQEMVTKDSTEAELVALSDMIPSIELCDEFIRSLGYKNVRPPLILQDNKSTISMVTQGGGKTRNKHLRARQYLVKARVDAKEAEIAYQQTEKMIADGLTKAIQGDRFKWIIDRIMGTPSDPALVDRGALSEQEN